MTSAEIKHLVSQLKGIIAILANAEPEDRKPVYSELNLAVVYHDDGRMQVSAGPDECTNECVGWGITAHLPQPATNGKWRQLAATGGNWRPTETILAARCRRLPRAAIGKPFAQRHPWRFDRACDTI